MDIPESFNWSKESGGSHRGTKDRIRAIWLLVRFLILRVVFALIVSVWIQSTDMELAQMSQEEFIKSLLRACYCKSRRRGQVPGRRRPN